MKKLLLAALLSCSFTPAWAMDLADVYSQAAASDPVYGAAVATRLANREVLAQSIASLLPTITGTASTVGNRVNSVAPFQATGQPIGTYYYNSKGYTLNLTQPLLNFSSWSQVSSSHYTAAAADANLAAAAQDLIVRVAQAYFNVLAAQDNLQYVRAEKAAFSRQQQQEQARYSVGLDAMTSVYNARAAYDAALAAEIAAQNLLHDNQEMLRQLTGQPGLNIAPLRMALPLLTPQPNDVECWVNMATQYNAALLAATFTMQAARQAIKVSAANHLPTLNAVGSYGRSSANGPSSTSSNNTDDRSVGLQLSVPIFSGGLTSSQVRQAQANFQAASANREGQYRQTVVLVRQKFNDVLAGISKIQADQQAVISAQNSLDSTEAAYKVGTRTIVDVLNAEQVLYQAKSNYSNDNYKYLIDTLLLKEAAGILAPSDLISINRWLQHADEQPQATQKAKSATANANANVTVTRAMVATSTTTIDTE